MKHPLPSRLSAAIVAALFVFFSVVGVAGAASAHGGPVELSLTPDGAGGVQVLGTYIEDGHTVDDVMDVTVTAVASDGRSVGPVSLVSAAEGQGRWVSAEPFLEDGDWTVTATITTPSEAQTVTAVTVAPLAPPVDSTRTDAPLPTPGATTDASEDATADANGSTPVGIVWAVSIGAVIVLVVLAVVLLRRRRAPKA